ncbi:MAG: hypothetical protein Q7V53_02865 [Caldisericota bacterium]|nr:hypothetical protein [Caldisericota bacterium]
MEDSLELEQVDQQMHITRTEPREMPFEARMFDSQVFDKLPVLTWLQAITGPGARQRGVVFGFKGAVVSQLVQLLSLGGEIHGDPHWQQGWAPDTWV